MIDFSQDIPSRKPTPKERKLFRKWVKYLSDSRLPKQEVYSRATKLTENKEQVPRD